MASLTKQDDLRLHGCVLAPKEQLWHQATRTTKAHLPMTRTTIFDLPIELRLRIFKFLFTSEYYQDHLRLKLSVSKSSPPRLCMQKRDRKSNANKDSLALFYTNRQINFEASSVFYDRKFVISLDESTNRAIGGWKCTGSLKNFALGPHIRRLQVQISIGTSTGFGYKRDPLMALLRTKTLVRAAKNWASLCHLEIIIDTEKEKCIPRYLSDLIPVLEKVRIRGSVKVTINTLDRHYDIDSVCRALEKKMKITPQTRYNLRPRIEQLNI